MKDKGKIGIIPQVALLFAVGVLTTGILTYFSQHIVSDDSIKAQTEQLAAEIADEVKRTLMESPAAEWEIPYWYEHAAELDIEYDVEYGQSTRTEKKYRLLRDRQPDIVLKYATPKQLAALPEEDQRLCAEISYSWLITRINQIKRSYQIDYLFCILTAEPYDSQFFLFSGADPGAVRGTNYEEVYTLGTTVSVSESQQEAMRNAVARLSHLADAGDYMDYYAAIGTSGGFDILIGMTYNLSGLRADIGRQTLQGTTVAIIHQATLSLFCLLLLGLFVLEPLKLVQHNIRLYKNTKDSGTVRNNLAQVQARNEIGQLSEDIVSLTAEIDDYMHKIETISADKERIRSELTLASRIQASMLPNLFPPFPDRKEFDIYASMDPAKEVGGDFYDFFLVDDDHLGVLIADVSGKGVPAALFMMASKILLQTTAMLGLSPAAILTRVNEAICSNNEEQMFVTVWMGILEISTGRLTCANAGHEYPVLRRDGRSFELFKDRHGFVIGGMEGMRYKEYELQLEPGSRLFVYTDGVPEATNEQQELFGTQRMIGALNRDPGASPKDILKNVRKAVDDFVLDAEQFDDLTMLCLQYNGPETEPKTEEA